MQIGREELWQWKKDNKERYKHLRCRGIHMLNVVQKQKEDFFKSRIGIDVCQRPSIGEKTIRFGDLEMGTVIGKSHKGA